MSIWYHGSNTYFENFDFHLIGSGTSCLEGPGFYFTDSIEFAKTYGKYLYEVEIDYFDLKTNLSIEHLTLDSDELHMILTDLEDSILYNYILSHLSGSSYDDCFDLYHRNDNTFLYYLNDILDDVFNVYGLNDAELLNKLIADFKSINNNAVEILMNKLCKFGFTHFLVNEEPDSLILVTFFEPKIIKINEKEII